MKIRNIVAALLATAAVVNTARAEGGLIDFGIKGGITTQNVKFKGVHKIDADNPFSTSSRAGFHLGAMARVNLPLVHLQPEILYSQTSYRLGIAQGQSEHPHKSIVRLKSVDVPVLVGLRMMWLHVQAGPMFTVMSETKMKDRGFIEDVGIARPSVSYLLGVGLEFGHFNFDVRFNGNFKKYTQSILYKDVPTYPTGGDFKSRHKYWMFSVGYMF